VFTTHRVENALIVVGISKRRANMANPYVEIIRAIARPAISVIFAAVIAQVVVEHIDAPEWFLAMAGGCILWWFGDRTVQHIKANNANSIDALANKVVAAIENKKDV